MTKSMPRLDIPIVFSRPGNMSTADIHQSVQSSELSRNSAAVFAAAEKGPIDITRRDGENFVLSLASEVARERRAVEIAASLLGAFLSTDDLPLAERLRQPFPWIEFLSPDSRDRFAEELVSVTRACASFGQFTRLLIVFEAWRWSAQAIASGYLPDDELHWIEDPAAVLDPRQQ